MLGNHFYHSIVRKTVSVFGTLFNDVKLIRRSGANGVDSMVKVPISYGPKQKFLARLDQQQELDETTKVALKLPRMSFEMTGLSYDSTTKQSMFNKLNVNSNTGTTQAVVSTSVPYNIDMQLNIVVKNFDDGLQIVEQILPNFQPTYNVSVKYLEGIDNSFDVPITLQNVSFVDDYEGDYESRRYIVFTLDFLMKVRFFGGVDSRSIIRQVYTNFVNEESSELIEMIQVQTNPTEARKDDNWEPQTALYFIPTVFQIELEFNSDLSNLQVGEIMLGETSGYTGRVSEVFYNSNTGVTNVTVRDVDGYFVKGELIASTTTGTGGVLVNYEILT